MHEISTFKDKPILKLLRNENDKYPFSFGVNKAKLIVENIKAIEKFAAKYQAKEVEEQERVLV